jgi:hypothetical protein
MNQKEIEERLDKIISSDMLMCCIYWSLVLILTKMRVWA